MNQVREAACIHSDSMEDRHGKSHLFSDKNKRRRIQWATEIKSKTMAYWKKVIFTDESKV